MAKQKFERTKPHMNIGTIGHVDHGKTLTKLQKKENVVSQFLLHTLNMKHQQDTMLTLTAQDMLTMLKT